MKNLDLNTNPNLTMIKVGCKLYISLVYSRDLEVVKHLMQLINTNLKTKHYKNNLSYKRNNSGELMFNQNNKRKKNRNKKPKELDI